jgi:2-polyprenyl-3-methyl-5-hydroxy-6-metoxy-1,4-benzoquinol methylase
MAETWNKAADVRRHQIESGVDITFCKVFIPFFEEIVKQLNPSTILEVGCGTGHLSAKLATNERKIQAIDPSENMCSLAFEILNEKSVKLEKCFIEDFTSTEKFDLILSHMCVQTVSDLESFFSSISYFLSGNSTFISPYRILVSIIIINGSLKIQSIST